MAINYFIRAEVVDLRSDTPNQNFIQAARIQGRLVTR